MMILMDEERKKEKVVSGEWMFVVLIKMIRTNEIHKHIIDDHKLKQQRQQ